MRHRIRAWRDRVSEILDREAKVRDLVKASLPLWISVVFASGAGIGVLSAQSQQREVDRDQSRMSSCQTRNSAQETARGDNLAILNGLRVPFPGAEVQEIIDTLTSAQSTPVDTDTDCDDDGRLTADDYGQPAPAGLPITIRGG